MRNNKLILGIGAAIAAIALYSPHVGASFQSGPSQAVAALTEPGTRALASGYVLGEVRQFTFERLIHLRSDRSNVSVRNHVQLPPGFVIENVWAEVTHKRHHATYNISWRQPMSVNLDQTATVSLREHADRARGLFSGKAKIEALAEVKRLSDAIRYASLLSASSHATINYSGTADGRRYSSRDGELDVTIHVVARYVGTVDVISREMADLAAVLAASSAEVIAARTERAAKAVTASTQAAGAQGIAKPKPEDEGKQ